MHLPPPLFRYLRAALIAILGLASPLAVAQQESSPPLTLEGYSDKPVIFRENR